MPPHELEIKLALPDEAAWRVVRDALGAPRTIRQVNHFFDTASRELDRRRIGVRLRAEADRRRLTVKGDTLDDFDPAVTRRVELESDVAATPFERSLTEGLVLAPWVARWRAEQGPDPGSASLLDAVAPWSERALPCFGAFENERTTGRLTIAVAFTTSAPTEPTDVVVELDRTRLPGDRIDFGLEVELTPATPPTDAQALRGALEEWLAERGISAAAAPSKLARFRDALDAAPS